MLLTLDLGVDTRKDVEIHRVEIRASSGGFLDLDWGVCHVDENKVGVSGSQVIMFVYYFMYDSKRVQRVC